MAQWQRDPKARRNVAYVLAATEVLALMANVYSIFSAYLLYVNARFFGSALSGPSIVYAGVAATVVSAGVGVVVAVMYVRGRAWGRATFIVANTGLVVLGVLWFAIDHLGAQPDQVSAWAGLLLPLVTLFPLLWPLITFRPMLPAGADGSGAG
ncbi:MAG TPA: hypothetical protein VM238_17515 [Phycisphaerae bacterium]|nr:hypothetical protein [Phycisphaerae bacterium]